jgi:hypothetical protein
LLCNLNGFFLVIIVLGMLVVQQLDTSSAHKYFYYIMGSPNYYKKFYIFILALTHKLGSVGLVFVLFRLTNNSHIMICWLSCKWNMFFLVLNIHLRFKNLRSFGLKFWIIRGCAFKLCFVGFILIFGLGLVFNLFNIIDITFFGTKVFLYYV